jgi:hypothetical protein
MNNYIVDVSNITEFESAKNLNTYNELINFFTNFDRSWYDERHIHNHIHHIIPKSEGGSNDDSNLVCLPYRYHIKSHYLRGKELEKKNDLFNAYKNYKSVRYSIQDSSLPETIQDLELKLDFVCESLQKEKELKKYAKYIWVSKDNKSIQIYEQDFEDMKKDGWERKRIFRNPSTKNWVTDGKKNRYIEKEEVENFLIQNPNFKRGFFANIKKSRASYSTLNTKWMTKNDENKAIKLEEIEDYLKNGWSLGHTRFSFKRGWKWSEEDKKFHWYTNGVKNIQSDSCPEGFRPGRTISQDQRNKISEKATGSYWWTNGKESIRAKECPEGFWRRNGK